MLVFILGIIINIALCIFAVIVSFYYYKYLYNIIFIKIGASVARWCMNIYIYIYI